MKCPDRTQRHSEVNLRSEDSKFDGTSAHSKGNIIQTHVNCTPHQSPHSLRPSRPKPTWTWSTQSKNGDCLVKSAIHHACATPRVQCRYRNLLNFDVLLRSVVSLHVVETPASLEIQVGTNELATQTKIGRSLQNHPRENPTNDCGIITVGY